MLAKLLQPEKALSPIVTQLLLIVYSVSVVGASARYI